MKEENQIELNKTKIGIIGIILAALCLLISSGVAACQLIGGNEILSDNQPHSFPLYPEAKSLSEADQGTDYFAAPVVYEAPASMTDVSNDEALKAILDVISEALIERADHVTLMHFGTFETTNHQSKRGVNPQTGDPIEWPARKSIKFRACKVLRQKLNEK